MFIRSNYVIEAVKAAGGPTAVSNEIRVANATVHSWIRKRRVPNLDKAKQLSRLSGISLDKLRGAL